MFRLRLRPESPLRHVKRVLAAVLGLCAILTLWLGLRGMDHAEPHASRLIFLGGALFIVAAAIFGLAALEHDDDPPSQA